MARTQTTTGGRAATTGVIPGLWALSVGHPDIEAPAGFRWVPLTDVARLESGHTPSRRRAEYWGGDIPWIGIRDATANHGRIISSTNEYVTQEGIDNSSARVLPVGTVCLSRTASVGYVVSMGTSMATSQDFVNWVCGPDLLSRYLHYIFMAEQESVRRFAYGSVHPTVYFPEVKAFHVCIPNVWEQEAIIAVLGALDDKIAVNERIAATCESLSVALASEEKWLARTELNELVQQQRSQVSPSELADDSVAHYSLPAFDASRAPEIVQPGTIKSAKFLIDRHSVLVSKLNPATPRIWDVNPDPELPALASTEFMVLRPVDGLNPAEVWSVCCQPGFTEQLSSRATGTSNSHQRVRPAELLKSMVVDVRTIPEEIRMQISDLAKRARAARYESIALAQLRDTLLPKLMSGQIRVRDAERMVEDAT